jgi:hypothetical protein
MSPSGKVLAAGLVGAIVMGGGGHAAWDRKG